MRSRRAAGEAAAAQARTRTWLADKPGAAELGGSSWSTLLDTPVFGQAASTPRHTVVLLDAVSAAIGRGVSLEAALAVAGPACGDAADLATALRADVLRGTQLSTALAAAGLPDAVVSVVAAGERHGALAAALGEAAWLLTHEDRLRSVVRPAATGLATALASVFALTAVLLLAVVPTLSAALPSGAVPAWVLPLQVLGWVGPLLATLAAAAGAVLALGRRLPGANRRRGLLAALLLRVPGARRALLAHTDAVFTRVGAWMLRCGADLPEVLTVAATATALPTMVEQVQAATRDLQDGQSLQASLQGVRVLAAGTRAAVAVGALTGALPDLLLLRSQTASADCERHARSLAALAPNVAAAAGAAGIAAVCLFVLVPLLRAVAGS